VKALIFDMDGLMIDTEKLYFDAERKLAGEFGADAGDQLLRKLMGRSPHEAMSIFKNELSLNAGVEELVNKRNDIMTYKYNNELVPMPGLHEIITFFYKKFKLAIATGSAKIFLDIAVDKLDIRKYFDVLEPSDEIKNGKPDPEIYLKTSGKLGLKPGECIVLEDSSNGALAAKRAGCYTIAVVSEYTKNQDFGFADKVLNDLSQAREVISLLL
jgi:HAD superfamily hydrolase (TIGR01509 family)